MIPPPMPTGTSWRGTATAWIVTNVIALVALVQPYLYWLWKKYFRKGRVDVHETAKVEIGYSGFGPTVGLFGTLRAVHEDQFVRSVELILTRNRDNQRRGFQWAAFRPATFVVGSTQTSLELASGFMLLTSEPWKYNILFIDPEFQRNLMVVIERVRNAWLAFGVAELVNRGVAPPIPDNELSELYDRFSRTRDHVEAYTAVDRMFDWQAVEYSIEVRVNTANPDATFSRILRFTLTEQDITNLRTNSIRVIQEACGRPTSGQYHFAYCSYI